MPRAVPSAIRKEVVRLHQKGKSNTTISEMLNLTYQVVCKILRQYRKEGAASFQLKYDRCGRKSTYGSAIRSAIDDQLRENEDLGAPIIRSRLIAQGTFEKVPHERTIQRWLVAQGKNKSRGRKPKQNKGYSDQVHHTWQVDAKEKLAISDGTKHCYLSFADEASCSFLKGYVFSLYPFD